MISALTALPFGADCAPSQRAAAPWKPSATCSDRPRALHRVERAKVTPIGLEEFPTSDEILVRPLALHWSGFLHDEPT